MGIHAKYHMSQYAFQDKEPEMYFSVDFYLVRIWDTEAEWDSELETRYEDWRSVRNYMDTMNSDSIYDSWNYNIIGGVVN